LELVWLPVVIGLLDENSDEDTDALGEGESDGTLVIDGSELTEILVVIDELADMEAEAVSL
jgi:hypothetical protein